MKFITTKKILIFIIFTSCFVLYFNTLFNDFVYDDNFQVKDNFWIRDIKFIPQMFLKDVWHFRSPDWVSNYYRPLMHLIYLLSYQIFSLKPWGYHLVNILFHASVSILVFLVTYEISKHIQPNQKNEEQPLYIPFFTAMIFAIHPLHTEVVAWISAIPDLSFSFFYLLGFYFYIKFRAGFKSKYYYSILCFTISLFSKEPAVTFILIIFLYDFFLVKKYNISQYLKDYIPFIASLVIYLSFRVYALKGFSAYQSHPELNTYQYIINIFPLVMKYIFKTFAPFNLNVFHVLHPIKQIYEIKGLMSILVFLTYITLLILSYKKNKLFFFGLLLFIIPLLPALYIPGVGENTFAERYVYLPLFGISICFSIIIHKFLNIPGFRNLTLIVIIAIGLIFSYLTIKRNTVWKNDITLWTDTLNKSPDWRHGLIELAISYEKVGNHNKALELLKKQIESYPDNYEGYAELGVSLSIVGKLDEAIDMYKKAIKINPRDYYSFFNMGKAFYDKGLKDKALEIFEYAIRLNPKFPESYVNAGIILAEFGQLERASENFKKAIEIKPGLMQAHFNLANYYQIKGDLDNALKHYKFALKVNPDYLKVRVNIVKILLAKSSFEDANKHLNILLESNSKDINVRFGLGEIFYSIGKFDQAIKEFQYVLLQEPENIQALFKLGNLYYRKKMLNEALLKYREILKYDPKHVEAHFNLGVVYDEKGMYKKAIEEYSKALEIDKNYAPAHENLGIIYAQNNMLDKAIYHLEKAIELEPKNDLFRKNLYRAYLMRKSIK